MVTPKSGKKSKKSEDGDEEDFSKVYADLVKLALKEQEKVKI
jgi:H/ACA ribonucleoprotein complex subunit 2